MRKPMTPEQAKSLDEYINKYNKGIPESHKRLREARKANEEFRELQKLRESI